VQASPKSRPARLVPRLLIAAGVLACVTGIVLHRLWAVLPLPRVAGLLVLALLSAALAWPLCRWARLRMATALGGVWLLALVAMSGVLPTLAVALLGIAAAALGGRVVGDTRPALAACVGLGLVAGLGGWLLPVPVFQPWLLAPLLLAVVVCRRNRLGLQFPTTPVSLQTARDDDAAGSSQDLVHPSCSRRRARRLLRSRHGQYPD